MARLDTRVGVPSPPMLKSYSTTSFSPGVTELLLEEEVLLLLLLLLEEEVLLLLLLLLEEEVLLLLLLLLEEDVLLLRLLLLEEEVLLLLLEKVFGFVVGNKPGVCNIEAYMLEMAWIGSINSE
jgi:hypothetical protein